MLEARVAETTARPPALPTSASSRSSSATPTARIVAGIYGWTWGGCAELQHLWVDESLRCQGVASRAARRGRGRGRPPRAAARSCCSPTPPTPAGRGPLDPAGLRARRPGRRLPRRRRRALVPQAARHGTGRTPGPTLRRPELSTGCAGRAPTTIRCRCRCVRWCDDRPGHERTRHDEDPAADQDQRRPRPRRPQRLRTERAAARRKPIRSSRRTGGS